MTALNIISQGRSKDTDTTDTIDIIDSVYTIDSVCSKCIGQNQSTLGMMQCTYQAQLAWDSVMYKYYNLLMDILKDDEKELLKNAQNTWTSFRDIEFRFSETTYYNIGGTMYHIICSDSKMNIVRTRALELKGYYDDLTGK